MSWSFLLVLPDDESGGFTHTDEPDSEKVQIIVHHRILISAELCAEARNDGTVANGFAEVQSWSRREEVFRRRFAPEQQVV